MINVMSALGQKQTLRRKSHVRLTAESRHFGSAIQMFRDTWRWPLFRQLFAKKTNQCECGPY